MSAGVTGASALLGGVSQFEAGETKSSLFKANQGVAIAQAQSEEAAGSYNESAQLRRGAAMTAQQINQIGGGNLQQAGTPAQVVASTAEVNEMDALQIRNNAARKAWGFRVQAASDQLQSEFAKSSGDFNAAGTILGGGAKAYTQAQAAGGWT
jgi:hypothetical protein